MTQQEYQKAIEASFPRLLDSDAYAVTSLATEKYNCIAWAAGDAAHFWWPDKFWPRKVAHTETLASFIEAFKRLGYSGPCDEALDKRFEKIAVFAMGDKPKHAARQLKTGLWTSKMGSAQDISHNLYDLNGGSYGDVAYIMRRRWPGGKSPRAPAAPVRVIP